MSASSTMWLITGREVRQRLRGKGFIFSTLALLAIVLAMGIIQRVASADDGPRDVTIGTVGDLPGALEARLLETGELVDLEITTVPQDDPDAARMALDDGDLDAVLDVGRGEVVYDGDEDTLVQAALQQAMSTQSVQDAMRDAGLSADAIDQILAAPPALTSETVGDDDGETVARVAGTVTSILLFISLQTFGSYILMGVVEEKSTAVVEVLLARVPATQLLAGKVTGIGAVALLQFVLTLAMGVVSLSIADIDVPSDVWTVLPWAVVWFLGGFAFYAMLFGLAGALVSRQEDAQSAVMPFGSMLVLAYIAVFILAEDPQSMAARVVSVLPPASPLLMPMRTAMGAASVLEIVVALVALVLAVIGVARFAGAIYSQVLLHRGTRLRWRAVLRSFRSGESAG